MPGAMTAILSSCGRYRYRLERTVTRDAAAWTAGAERAVAFLMLNPSIADATIDDPTIRRCVGYARAWGFGRLIVGNVYALRATNPKALRTAVDPIGPENTPHLKAIIDAAQLVVCAWGANADRARARAVVGLICAAGQQLHVLGVTKDGHPRHPLYARADLCPTPWDGYADDDEHGHHA